MLVWVTVRRSGGCICGGLLDIPCAASCFDFGAHSPRFRVSASGELYRHWCGMFCASCVLVLPLGFTSAGIGWQGRCREVIGTLSSRWWVVCYLCFWSIRSFLGLLLVVPLGYPHGVSVALESLFHWGYLVAMVVCLGFLRLWAVCGTPSWRHR